MCLLESERKFSHVMKTGSDKLASFSEKNKMSHEFRSPEVCARRGKDIDFRKDRPLFNALSLHRATNCKNYGRITKAPTLVISVKGYAKMPRMQDRCFLGDSIWHRPRISRVTGSCVFNNITTY